MVIRRKIIVATVVGILMAVGVGTQESIQADAHTNNDFSNYQIVYEEASKDYIVNVNKATVRKSPSNSAAKLGHLKRGTKVSVYNISNGWGQINYRDNTGYVRLSELKEVETPSPAKTGTITVKYLEEETRKEISTSDYYENLELKEYSYTAKEIDGYTISTNQTQSIAITEASPNATIEFLYKINEETENPENEQICQRGIFSWRNTQCTQNMREDTHYWIDRLELNEIYQADIFSLTSSQTKDFVTDLKVNKDVDVYDLTGDPSWYSKPEEFIRKIDRVKNYNNTVPNESKVKGVAFDVEPWVLGDGNWSQRIYANTIKKAYEYAQSVGVEMIMVIPFWLETANSEIIIQNSDKTIVMNYNIKNPVKFIQEEIELAKKYDKRISTAAETKKIDSEYGVDESTTYYYVGVDRLKQDWTNIYNTYEYDKLEFSLHDLHSVKEFIK